MVDIHRHFHPDNPIPSHPDALIWFATSRVEEWERYRGPDRNYHGYGFLPSVENPDFIPDIDQLREALAADLNSYIGEVGDEPFLPPEKQRSLVENILILAREVKVPVVFHHRGSIAPMVPLLKQFSRDIPLILHQFTGSVETARELHRLGISVSLSPKLRERKMKLSFRLKELDIPFFIETDYTGSDEDHYLELLHQQYEWVSRETAIPLSALVEKQYEQSSILADRTASRC